MATMAEETRDRIEDLATQQAYQQGRRDADVDARLLGHERRLNAINGSIERHAKNAEKLAHTMDSRCDGIEDKLDALITAQQTRDAIEEDRQKTEAEAEESAERGLSHKQFWLGTIIIASATVLAAVLAAVVTAVITGHPL